MVRGDFTEATRWLRRMLAAEHGAPSVPQEATGHLNVARCMLFRGELDEGERHLTLALERCQQFRIEGLVGEVLEYYGNLSRERLDFARAADFYRRAIRAYEESGIALWRREVLEERAVLAFEMGDAASALTALERLVAERGAAGDETGATTATATRGRLLAALGEHAEAAPPLEAALAFFREHGLYSYEAQASISLASCAKAAGDRKAMLAHLRRALDLAARYDYEYWLRREVARNAALFEDSDAREMLPPDVAEILPRLVTPPGSPPVVVEPAPPAADLTVRLLGPVDIVRDPARPIPPDAWTTRRSRDILCYLASRKGRRASKDTIIDTFWAETDFEAVEKNFHPTISHIRKALNRGQLIKQNFLVYRDGDYLLNPDFTYQIDVEAFDRLYDDAEGARRAGDAARRLALVDEALALYRGEFMQGSYDDWVEEPREHFAERRLLMLEAVARAASEAGDWPRALELATAILHCDQYREDVHCLAMRAHAAMGNRGAVKDQYEALKRLLRDELGVDPDPATRKTYQDLLKS
jgi:DNA-binding SARP family transcriptional activator